MKTITDIATLFSLCKIRPIIETYAWPGIPIDPKDNWKRTYRLYFIATGHMSPQGQIKIQRQTHGRGSSTLILQLERQTQSETSSFVDMTLACVCNPLCTPQSYNYAHKMSVAPDARPLPYTHTHKQADIPDSQLKITQNSHMETIPLKGDFTHSWSLFDAVQYLAHPNLNTLHFTLIDENDQVWPDQILRYHQTVTLKNEHGQQTLTALEHLGPGTLPCVYWIDEQGRLLFVLRGLEATILIQENQQPIAFKEAGRIAAQPEK